MRVKSNLAAGLLVVTGFSVTATAAPVLIQDYEAPGNLDAPFNLVADFAGQTTGVNGATDAITHVADDGANGTAASAQHVFEHLTSESPTAGGWQWQVRILPNAGGNSDASNPTFTSDGYVGYWLKVDPSVTAEMKTAPILESTAGTGTATAGVLRDVENDGQWHLYQWNMDEPADFNNTFSGVFGGAALGDTSLEGTVLIDSIALVSPNGGNATFRIDQIGYDNAGPLPEPSLAGLAALGLLSLGRMRCR
jgi:hypothetical protein